MGTGTKEGGDAALIRWFSVTVKELAVSSTSRAEITTGSVERGTMGEWFASRTIGAMLLVNTEFALPGVPLVGRLARQFWPELLERLGFNNSTDFPSPSCSASHTQPRWVPSNGPRWRTAQSPSSAYSTLSARLPSASSRSKSSWLLFRMPVHPPTTFVMPGYFVANVARSAATTRYPPPGRITFGKVNCTPPENRQPFRFTAAAPLLKSS